MITRTSLRLSGCRLIDSQWAFAVTTARLAFLGIMHDTTPLSGIPRDTGSAAFLLGMIVLLTTGLSVVQLQLTS